MISRHRPAAIRERDSDSLPTAHSLPWEFFRRLRLRTAGRGELRLAVAVLEDAIRCLEGSRDAGGLTARLLRWEAEQWIRSTDCRPLFSFERICSLLGLDTDDLRGNLLREPRLPPRLEVPMAASRRDAAGLPRGFR